jgi:hypothetical protein
MELGVAVWTDQELELARRVFERALHREVEALIETLRSQASALRGRDDVWQLHDFLSIQRHAIEGRQEFQLTGLLFVFADFVRDGLASLDELDGLSADKIAKISAMARMG